MCLASEHIQTLVIIKHYRGFLHYINITFNTDNIAIIAHQLDLKAQ